jgi:hypothetical protein
MTAPKNADDGDNRSGEEIHARALDNVVRLDGGAVEVQNSVKRIQVENPGGNRIGEFKCKSREDHGQSGAETELPKNPKWAIDRLPTDGRLTREQVEGHHENQTAGNLSGLLVVIVTRVCRSLPAARNGEGRRPRVDLSDLPKQDSRIFMKLDFSSRPSLTLGLRTRPAVDRIHVILRLLTLLRLSSFDSEVRAQACFQVGEWPVKFHCGDCGHQGGVRVPRGQNPVGLFSFQRGFESGHHLVGLSALVP